MEDLISAYVQYITFFFPCWKDGFILGAKFFVMREIEEFKKFQWATRIILFRVLKYILTILTFYGYFFCANIVKAEASSVYLLIYISHPMHWRRFASQLCGLYQSPR